MDSLIRDGFYDKLNINGLIAIFYTNTQVGNLLAQKQPTITSSTDLTINKLITRTWEPLQVLLMFKLKPIRYILEPPVWLTATSLSAKFSSPVYVDQVMIFQNGISIGMYSAGCPNQFAQTATISQNENITTQGSITCQGKLAAPTISANRIICNSFEPTHVNTEMNI